ncbi:MAG: transposase [Chthoniobacteraceae bacterium]
MNWGRKHPVHYPPIGKHNAPVIIFLTVNSKDRKKIFTTSRVHEILLKCWTQADAWLVGRYVIMPDHIHLFCAPGNQKQSVSLLKWVSYWKSISAQAWPDPSDDPVWHRHFWDTQLRHTDSYDKKWDYVLQNPIRANLSANTDDWPYQGECNILRWY